MKKILISLIIITIILIGLGIFAGISIKNEIIIGTGPINVYVDGINFTGAAQAFTPIFSRLICFVIVIFSILAIVCIWGIYGIVVLILWLVKRHKKI